MNLFHCCHLTRFVLLGLGLTLAATADGTAPAAFRLEKVPAEQRARAPAIAWATERFNWCLREGDDIRWAQPDWDDRDWQPLDSRFDTPAGRGIFWLRFRVRSPNPADRVPAGAWIASMLAYELYWDGELIVRNGVPANRAADEVTGLLDVMPRFPERLTGPGEHVVAMRVSSYRAGPPGTKHPWVFFVNDPAVIQTWHMRNGIIPVAGAGALIILGLVYGLIWYFGARRGSELCLGVVCGFAGAAQLLKALRWFTSFPVAWTHPVGVVSTFLGDLLALSLVAFVGHHFAVPRRRWILVGVIPVLLFVHWITPVVWARTFFSLRITMITYGVALSVLVWAAWKRRAGAWPVILGIIASAAWILSNPFLYEWNGFLPRFLPVLVGLFVAVAAQHREERKKTREAELSAARLEIEVLKKSLQPHFLMNTLTALAQTVEENPAGAVKFIDDLAEEFRTLSAVSGEKQVPLARELALCHAHLRVMRARTDVEWRLETEGVNADAPVPPAIFLTLIENGFSHQEAQPGATTFKLRAEPARDAVRYTFFSPGTVTADASRTAGGTGLRYIRARLEESFPGAWSFVQAAVPGGWETMIELRAPAMKGAPA